MTTWNDRLIPYPLLAPWTDDYGDAVFSVTIPHAILNNGENINLTIKYHLTSNTLRELVSNGQAQYVGLIVCPKTFTRNTYPTNQEDNLQRLDASQYADDLKLTPYIVATQRIEGLKSEEYAEEIKIIKPEGFDIAPGSILAVGDSTEITLEEGGSPYSVIDLIADTSVNKGLFKVSLDDNRIKIHLAPDDKNQMEALRQQEERASEIKAVFFPAVYLHAVTEALRNLSYPGDKHWEHTIQKALERRNITVDLEILHEDALTYAQKLMENPLGTLLTAFVGKEEE